MKKSLKILAAAIALAVLFTGCGSAIKESDMSYASPIVDNLLTALQEKDYAKFCTDLGDTAKSAITEDGFIKMAEPFADKIGDYQSKTFAQGSNVTQNKIAYTVIVYNAKYSKESGDVIVTVTFGDKDGKKTVESLNFNSPNLRK